MESLKICPICNTIMSEQSYEDPTTKDKVRDHVCFACGYTERFEEGDEDNV